MVVRLTYAERIAYDYERARDAAYAANGLEDPVVIALLVIAMNIRRLIDAAGDIDPDQDGTA
jgi:hypothetical protein